MTDDQPRQVGGDGPPAPGSGSEDSPDAATPAPSPQGGETDDGSPPVRADGGAFGTPPDTVERSLATRLSLRPGLLLGMAAFVGTYAVMYVLRAGKLASAVGGLPFTLSTSTPEITQVVGWLVYRAHFVPIEYSVSGAGSRSGILSFGSLPGATDRLVSALEPGLLLVVPVFMLFLAGFYAAIECDVTSPRTGAVAGATVVTGYLVLVAAAVVVMTWHLSLSMFDFTLTASIGPEEVRAVFIAGVLYPLAGGALGGAAAGKVTGQSVLPETLS